MKIFYKIYNKPGYGFPEKVYENAMMLEFKKGKYSSDSSICNICAYQ
ncbi:MAG: hypothetical protein JETT_2876 [Candidatus Jettenia ecosi]|uniref:Uncharacterized protein n=1 Tax=Candidatus Jettenia ecosi TaxID=2494326 RepID=A0A533Q880_9BACT|nr:MAG: hypothetical protein JETT_2876 [Candidatus Jettenia ecosi]